MAAHRVDGHQEYLPARSDLTKSSGIAVISLDFLLGGYPDPAAIPSSLAQAVDDVQRGPSPCPASWEPRHALCRRWRPALPGALGLSVWMAWLIQVLRSTSGRPAVAVRSAERRMQSREGDSVVAGGKELAAASRGWLAAQRWMAVGPSQPQTMPQTAITTTISTSRCLRRCACAGGQRGTSRKYEPMDSTFTHLVVMRGPGVREPRPRQVIHDHPTGENRSHL